MIGFVDDVVGDDRAGRAGIDPSRREQEPRRHRRPRAEPAEHPRTVGGHPGQLMTNILVIGKGGREHALVWKLKQSPRAGQGVLRRATPAPRARARRTSPSTAPIRTGWLAFCLKEQIGLVVIGPEDPLAAGLADYLRGKGLKVFGPSKEAARIEGSKVFCEGTDAARRRADRRVPRLRPPRPGARLHRDARLPRGGEGRRAGRGQGRDRLQGHRRRRCRRSSGSWRARSSATKAGRRIVVEKKLDGEELSVLALVSGRTILPLPRVPGPQGGLRRRQGAEHRRHGRVLPGPGRHAETARGAGRDGVRARRSTR